MLVDKSWNAAVLEDFADYRAGVKIPTLGPADLGAMDKGPFSSLVTGRVSRSWFALRTDGLSEIARVVGFSRPRS